jgi:putative phage-type endonuclease
MTELFLEQGSQEWLDFRIKHRMASETPAVMGLSPYQKASDIRRIKNGGAGSFVNNAMRQGTQQEPLARKAYSDRIEPMRPAVFVNGDYGASLDGINFDQTVIWECKVPVDGTSSERWKLAEQGYLTDSDMAQVQHQLMVTGALYCDFCVWSVDLQDFIMVKVLPAPDFWVDIDKSWKSFWATLGIRTDTAWMDAVVKYQFFKQSFDRVSKEFDQAKRELQELLNGESNEGNGIRVQRIKVKGRTDWDKVQEVHLKDVDLSSFKKPDTEQIRINEIKE